MTERHYNQSDDFFFLFEETPRDPLYGAPASCKTLRFEISPKNSPSTLAVFRSLWSPGTLTVFDSSRGQTWSHKEVEFGSSSRDSLSSNAVFAVVVDGVIVNYDNIMLIILDQ